MKLVQQVAAYQMTPAAPTFREFINETFSAPIDPATWLAWGSGSIVNGQYLFPVGQSGNLMTVQQIPAGATFQMDVIVPNCPAGSQYFGICALQYDMSANAAAIGVNLFVECDGTTITGVQIQNNDGLFYISIPLNLCQITGTTLVLPQFKIKVLPNYFTLSVGGTQVVNWYNTYYQPTAGLFWILNDSSSGVSLAFDNIIITEGISAWQGLVGLPGITVLQGLVLTAPLDSRGHGHSEDILPVGTNFAILVLTKGTDSNGHHIDGFDTLKDLEGPHHTGQDWDKISDDLGGLVFFGSLTPTAKKQFQAIMKGYSQTYN